VPPKRSNPSEDQPPQDVEALAEAVDAVLALVGGTRIADIEVEWAGGSVRVRREPSAVAARPLESESPLPKVDRATVTSLFVGIFHQEPASSFPAIGDDVRAGQTIAHVETLGIQNSVLTAVDGSIVEVLVPDGTPVEYGQPLIVVRPASFDDVDAARE